MVDEDLQQVIEGYQRLLERLKAQRVRLDERIDHIEEELKYTQSLEVVTNDFESMNSQVIAEESKYTGMGVADAAYAFLCETGREMHVRLIWRELANNGIRSSAKQPIWMLSTLLAQDERFERVEPGVFRARGETNISDQN